MLKTTIASLIMAQTLASNTTSTEQSVLANLRGTTIENRTGHFNLTTPHESYEIIRDGGVEPDWGTDEFDQIRDSFNSVTRIFFPVLAGGAVIFACTLGGVIHCKEHKKCCYTE